MFDFIISELKKQNIELVSCLHLDEATIKRPYLLEKNGISDGSVIIFAVPYLASEIDEERNVSAYSVSKDYHLFFSSLFDSLIPKLKEKYPLHKFVGFTDHSPINEIEAGAKCGLGVIGKNHLLITEKYSSYVFIGEIITDAFLPSFASDQKYCSDCGKCRKACPTNMNVEECLSALTQKKGGLTDNERAIIKKSGCAWGCDICQEVCPLTQKAIKNGTIYTNINFFKAERTPFLTSEQIKNMSDEDFSSRAYSWRGRSVIKRNLKILEGKEG